MFTRNMIGAGILALAVLAPATSFAASKQPCVLDSYQVTSVAPYRADQPGGKATFNRVQGVEIFVQAQPGLTAEWLRLEVTRYLTRMQRSSTRMHDCAFDVSGTRVQVDPAGTGFSVKLIARDPEQAQEVLRRARLLLG
jgi:hypothetical protein